MNKIRRKEIQRILDELYELRDAVDAVTDEEQEYLDNIPENLQSGERYEAAEEAVSQLGDALYGIDSALEALENATGD